MSNFTDLIRPLSDNLIKDIEQRPHGLLALDEHFLRSPHEDVFFVFVEKVGCTFLKHILVTEMIGDISSLDPEYYLPGLKSMNLIHALSHEALREDGRLVLASASAKTITFCRNPYARFVSAFRDKIENPPDLEIPYFYWVRREILFEKARYAAQGNAVTFHNNISIDEFAEFVHSQANEQRDKHWAEQCSLNLADVVKHNEVVRMEDFHNNLSAVWNKYFGKEINQVRYLTNASHSKIRPVLSNATAKIIYEIYKKDFEVFGYDIDSWKTF